MIEVLVWMFEGNGYQDIFGSAGGTDIVIHRTERKDGVIRHTHRASSPEHVEGHLLTLTKSDECDGAVMVMPPTVLRIPAPLTSMSNYMLGEWIEQELVPVVEARMLVEARMAVFA